jgi:hypothetical protein
MLRLPLNCFPPKPSNKAKVETIAYCPLPIAYCLLSIFYCLLSIIYSL